MAAEPDAPRWAQLTYASFDAGNGSGGWQVKETRGDLTPSEQREIAAHLVTSFDAHAPLPEYPTPDDVAAQPRRCTHLVGHGGPIGAGPGPAAEVTTGCTIHAVQAGSDSTGRPGNVFSHAVLDRRPGEPSPRLRPIEFWRSFDLLTPFGAEQVLAATLREGDFPRPSGLVGRDLVLDFVFDPATWRMGVLSVLLDAVDEAIRGGRRVVLLTASPDQAALWIGAVSWCMAPSTARTLSWSVYERAARLGSVFDRGVHLACVPHDDADGLDPEAPGVVIIDDRELPSLGQLDGAPHRTAAGHDVPVTPWSTLVQEAFVDEPRASRVLERIDAIADGIGRYVAPAWPLAVAHLTTSVEGADTTLASRVAVAEAPAGELDDGVIEPLRRAVVAGLGRSAADAWPVVAAAPAGSQLAAIAGAEYVRRAFGDAAWLTRPGGVPVPGDAPQLARDGEIRDAYAEALSHRDTAVVLRAADVGLRVGLTADAELERATHVALRDRVAPRLLASAPVPTDSDASADTAPLVAVNAGATDHDAGGADPDVGAADPDAGPADLDAGPAAFLERVGRLDPRVHHELVPGAIAAHLRASTDRKVPHPGSLLGPTAGRWLAARGLPRRHDETDDADARVALELALHVVQRDPSTRGAGRRLAELLLERYGSWSGVPPELRVVAPRHLWRLDELMAIERAHPGELPEKFLVPNLACASPSRELTALAEAVAVRTGTFAADVARLRLDAEAAAARPSSLPCTEVLRLAESLCSSTFAEHVAVEVFGPLVVESAAVGAAARLDADDWPGAGFPALRASAATPGVAAAAASNVAAHVATSPNPGAIAVAAGLVALEVATNPANAARVRAALSAQAREVGRLTDGDGHRVIETIAHAVTTAAMIADPAVHASIAAAAARRLGDAERSSTGPEKRAGELMRLVAQRFPPPRARLLKEP